MAYTSKQYAAQAAVQQLICRAEADGLCAVCHQKKRARWRDTGEMRMTCGSDKCFIDWLPVKGLHQARKEKL